ncbi:MAG: GDP-mannose 4,6-dehydratase [Burkholderiales bacterium]
MIKLLATGASGFVGQALQRHLLAGKGGGVELCGVDDAYDLLDAAAMHALIARHRPDSVLHLAAQSHVPTAMQDPAGTLQVNVVGTANLLKALTDSGFVGRLLYVSSADVYGAVAEAALPVTEDTPPAPRNPYAASKVAAEVLCLQWQRSHGLDVVIARPFNHTGPGQRDDFALSGFARGIAAIALGLQPPQLRTGNLQVTRDFLDVQDVLDAYLTLLQKGHSGQIYNVCSGVECGLHEALQTLMDLAGVQVDVQVDASRLRPGEQLRMCGSHQKIRADTGWQPQRPLRETLQQLLQHWTQELTP